MILPNKNEDRGITREEAIKYLTRLQEPDPWEPRINTYVFKALGMAVEALEQEPQTGQCKNCKWWKDSDGVYRRGSRAESRCPINHEEVYKGNGYCFLYESQKGEKRNEIYGNHRRR